MIKQNKYKIKCILFDWDGTLINDLPALKKIYFNFLKRFREKGSKEEFNKSLNGLTIPQVVKFLKKQYNLPYNYKELLKEYEENIVKAMDSSKPFKSAQQVLQKFKKMNLCIGLVTSSKKKYVWETLTKLKWENYFNFYVFGNEIKKTKPNPDIYLLALKKSGFKNTEALAVEDSTNGVIAAKNAGIITIGVSKNKHILKKKADFVISDLSKLPFLIKND